MVINNGGYHTMEFKNIIKKKLSNIYNFVMMCQGIEMCIFGESIHHYHDNNFFIWFWMAFNKIHWDIYLGVLKYG